MLSRIALLCVLSLTAGVFGEAAAADDPARIYEQSTVALYNLDFSTASAGYEGLTREYADNPDYWNAFASSIWLKILYDQQKLNIESFSGRSSFGTGDSRDSVNPADEKRLREVLATAMAKANAKLKTNPNDIRALYALGVSNATLASFEGTAKRSYMTAHSKAKTARDLHQKVLERDPSFDDARLAVGTYDYVIGVIPGVIRFLLAPFGIRGAGKEAGIQQLETAAAKGKYAATDARIILTVIYTRERNLERALALTNELHAKYPRNFLLDLAKASIYRRMQKWNEAITVYERALAKINAHQDGYDRLRRSRVQYLIATANLDRHEFEKAIDAFTSVTTAKDSPPNERASAYLWLGKLFDSKNERTRALQEYDALLALDCDKELKAEAQKYKRRPYRS